MDRPEAAVWCPVGEVAPKPVTTSLQKGVLRQMPSRGKKVQEQTLLTHVHITAEERATTPGSAP